jgi:hypothetical protein
MAFDYNNVKISDFYSFETVGQDLTGKVTDVRLAEMPSHDLVLQLDILPEGQEKEVTLTCGPQDLRRKVKGANVQPGDVVKIVYTGGKTTGGGYTAKLFTVDVLDKIPF